MTEELITEMSRIQTLKVISRTSVMDYKGTRKHLPQIARELGADGIVEGSVVRDGDQVRVTVQLLNGPDDRHLWSEEYQRPLHGILDLQREIAQSIARSVSAQITPEQQTRLHAARVVDPEAYEAYLRGRYYLYNQSSMAQSLDTAKRYFETAIEKDPGFALAYSGLADVYVSFASFRHLSPEQAYRSAKQAFSKALALDDGLSDAHATVALLSWQDEWDWAAAEREFNYSIALDPELRLRAGLSRDLPGVARPARGSAAGNHQGTRAESRLKLRQHRSRCVLSTRRLCEPGRGRTARGSLRSE